jgi:adenylate cyclase
VAGVATIGRVIGSSNEQSRLTLLGDNPRIRFGRRVFRLLPSQPRCKLCASPFGAPVGPLMKALGKTPWPKNPKYCRQCFREITRRGQGAEVDCSLLFADVRGSTSLAETMSPHEFSALMNRFFELASKILVNNDAIVDKFVGDEIIGLFIPALAGADHAGHAINAGRELLAATAAINLPVGAGVNTGVAFVGAVGEGDNLDLTAMGDPVNVAARLASAAASGELLVTRAAATAAQLADTDLERRELELKGKTEKTQVVVVRAKR